MLNSSAYYYEEKKSEKKLENVKCFILVLKIHFFLGRVRLIIYNGKIRILFVDYSIFNLFSTLCRVLV